MKKHYLLFDSGCSLCTSLARQVEEVSDGKLIARSLRDPEMHSILDAENPGWSWEPMLLEVGDEGRQIYTGVGMRLHLARVLGPRQALEVAQIVQKATFFQPARRGVLKLAGGLVASLALGGWASKSVKAGDGPISWPASMRMGSIAPSASNLSGGKMSDLTPDEDRQIRENALLDPSVHYMYAVAMGSTFYGVDELLSDTQVIGYLEEHDVYVVQLGLNPRQKLHNSLFLPLISGGSYNTRINAPAIETNTEMISQTSDGEPRLLAAYSDSQKKVLATFEIKSEVITTIDEESTEITIRFADREMHVRIDKYQPDQPKIVSNHPLTIDTELAAQLHYAYDEDPSLVWYRSQLGVVEPADGVTCSIICSIVSLGCWWAGPLCVAFAIVACAMICSPSCVGEGC